MREQAARGDAEAISALEARGENLPERINGMESSGKRPVAANRIADWDCAVGDGGRKAVYSRAGVKGRPIRPTDSDEDRTAVLWVEKRLRTGLGRGGESVGIHQGGRSGYAAQRDP